MHLPISVTQDELLEVLLQVAPVRPVFIWGAPGIGKSALVENSQTKSACRVCRSLEASSRRRTLSAFRRSGARPRNSFRRK